MENITDLESAEFAAIEEALKAVSSHAAPLRETSHATWQEDRGMNDRIKMLRHQSETTQPYIDMERALIETETYKRYEGALSIPELRGQVLHDYFERKTIRIEPGELIVGECCRILQEEYPALAQKVQVMLPDEKFRRVGQSMAAASLPEVPDAV